MRIFQPTISGSLDVSGSLLVSGSITVTGSYMGWFNSKMSSNLSGGLNGDLGYAALYNFDGYGGPVPNSPDNSWNESVISVGFSGRGLQIAGGYDTGNIYFRKGNSTWQSWSRILNASIDSYAASMNQNVTTFSQVTFAGITGSLQGTSSYATTSATAATASLVNGTVNVSTAYIGGALYNTAIQNAVSSNTSIYTVSTVVGYTSAFVDYYVTDGGANARSGQIQVAYVGGQVVYSETTTQDIGNTSGFQWNVSMSGTDISFDSVVASGTWNIKLIAKVI